MMNTLRDEAYNHIQSGITIIRKPMITNQEKEKAIQHFQAAAKLIKVL